MNQDELNTLPRLPWMESRIPKRDALVAFVAEGAACPSAVENSMKGTQSRWFPETGGHRVLILHDGKPFDTSVFHVETEAWDHEHCDLCGERIVAMALCHVTETGPYILLCESCFGKHVKAGNFWQQIKIRITQLLSGFWSKR